MTKHTPPTTIDTTPAADPTGPADPAGPKLFKRAALATLLVVVALAWLLVMNAWTNSGPGGVAPTPPAFASGISLQQAAQQAAGKPLVAVVSADWCGPCQTYKRNALSDPRVSQLLNAAAFPVIFDTDRQPDAARALHAHGIPATIIIHNDKIHARATGALPPEDLLTFLNDNGITPPTSAPAPPEP